MALRRTWMRVKMLRTRTLRWIRSRRLMEVAICSHLLRWTMIKRGSGGFCANN